MELQPRFHPATKPPSTPPNMPDGMASLARRQVDNRDPYEIEVVSSALLESDDEEGYMRFIQEVVSGTVAVADGGR